MSYVITLVDYRPSPRYPPILTPWTRAQMAYSQLAAGPFTPFDTVTLSPVDADPVDPQVRNLTSVLSPSPGGFFQVTFLDAAGNEEPTDPVRFPVPGFSSGLTLDELKARVETDLEDDALQALIDTNEQEIVARYGPYRDPDSPITESIIGRRRRIDVARPIDPAEEIVIVETEEDASQATLDDNDYRVWGGRFLERLWTGPNRPLWRTRWAPKVDVTYVPTDDTARRNEVTVKLVMLSIEYKGVTLERVGDVETSYGASRSQGDLVYNTERERLLESLQVRGAVMIR